MCQRTLDRRHDYGLRRCSAFSSVWNFAARTGRKGTETAALPAIGTLPSSAISDCAPSCAPIREDWMREPTPAILGGPF